MSAMSLTQTYEGIEKESKNNLRTQIETQLIHVIYQTEQNWIKNKSYRLKSTKEQDASNRNLRQHIEQE